VTDRCTGREVFEKPNHHFMFIKLEYWGAALCAIGLGLLIKHLAG
jgi:hypothetical protein